MIPKWHTCAQKSGKSPPWDNWPWPNPIQPLIYLSIPIAQLVSLVYIFCWCHASVNKGILQHLKWGDQEKTHETEPLFSLFSLSGQYGASQKCWRSMFETTTVPLIYIVQVIIFQKFHGPIFTLFGYFALDLSPVRSKCYRWNLMLMLKNFWNSCQHSELKKSNGNMSQL